MGNTQEPYSQRESAARLPTGRMMRAFVAIGLGLGLILTMGSASAEPEAGADQAAGERPRVGLVLGGGGARGFAHIGVLRVLEDAGVPIDIIVGTSMGAVVGGLYAAGRTPADLEQAAQTIDWTAAFQDRGPRDALSMRRKADDRRLASDFSIGLSLRGIEFPRGAIQGQRLTQLLRAELGRNGTVEHFDDLPIPFRPVAVDLESGDTVAPEQGDLALAIRASMSIPGIVAPVQWDDRLLVDGGLGSNVPVEIARNMGADVIIAVDVGNVPADDLSSAFQVMDQALRLMIRKNVAESRARLSNADTYLRVDIEDMGSTDFDRAGVAIAAGERAARGHRAEFRELAAAVDGAWSRETPAPGTPEPPRAPVIRTIHIDNRSTLDDRLIESHLDVEPGERLDRDRLRASIDRIFGLGYFERVDYQITNRSGNSADLEIVVEPQSWGPNYLRFGLTLEDDFGTRSTFQAAASYLRTEVNSWGAEFQADLTLGDEPRVATEWWQPLAAGSPWFVLPYAEWIRSDVALFSRGERIGEVRLTERFAGIGLGRTVGTAAQIQIGLEAGNNQTQPLVGETGRPADETTTGAVIALATWDTFDDPVFPRRGINVEFAWRRNSATLGADAPFTRGTLAVNQALALGRNRWILAAEAGATRNTRDAPVQSLHRLGGFLNLGGFRRDEITGTEAALLQLTYIRDVAGYRAVGGLPLFLGGAVETGNAWDDEIDRSDVDGITAGTLFAATETPLGPVFLGYAVNDEGADSAYLSLGRTF